MLLDKIKYLKDFIKVKKKRKKVIILWSNAASLGAIKYFT